MAKLEITLSLLQYSVSHDPSEIILICWFGAEETFLIINVENNCAAFIFYICLRFFEGHVFASFF